MLKFKNVCIGFVLLLLSIASSAQTFNVGIYQNPPLVSVDTEGNPKGFFIEILEHIALEENWSLNYKSYSFSEALEALEKGEIDILPALGHSLEREEKYYFTKGTLLTSWAEFYVNEGDTHQIDDIMDLDGVSIGALTSDFFLTNGYTGLLRLFDELGIEAEIREYPTYSDVLQSIVDEEVQVGMVSRIYGDFHAQEFDLVKTTIQQAHVSLRFGFAKQPQLAEQLIPVFDAHINRLLNDRSSVYYNSQNKFLSPISTSLIPNWLWKVLLVLGIGIAVLGSVSILLQAQVRKKTDQLEKANKELVASTREARLAAKTIESSKDIGFWFKPGETFNRVNKAAIDLLGYSKEELLNMRPISLLASDRDTATLNKLRDSGWDGHLRMESLFKTKLGDIIPVEISLDRIDFEGIDYICGFARDISKRLTSEAALVKSEERLQLALQAANEGLWDIDFQTGLISFDDNFIESLGYNPSELAPVRETWFNLMHPDDFKIMDQEFEEFIRNSENFFSLEFRIKNNAGAYVWFLFHGKVTDYGPDKKPLAATGTIVNINDLKATVRENESLLLNLTERNKELRCLYAVSQLVADGSKSVEDVLHQTIKLVPDALNYPELACVKITNGGQAYMSANFNSTAWELKAPIISLDGKVGEIEVYYNEQVKVEGGNPFLREEQELVEALGKQLGSMIDVKNAQFKVVSSILDTEDRERKRISKEIHDSIGQTLSAITLNMDMVKKDKEALGDKAKQKLATSIELLHQAVSEARSISHNLMPVILSDFGYEVSVENMLESIGDVDATQYKFYTNLNGKRLPDNIELSLFRITQEAVNNIIKHSEATEVTIQLMQHADMAILTVEDNGKGFDLDHLSESSIFGLNSMKNRALSIHGTYILDSTPGRGTIITVEVPLKEQENENIVSR
jgi:two-component system NarL family sensor kinase